MKPSELERLGDDELLDLRLSDLGLNLQRSSLAPELEQLARELARKGIGYRPRVWLSTEFFSPDGIPGFAIPFHLASPRLAKLERAQMLWVEGARKADRMRLLRHEAGHAIDTAYRLSQRPEWRSAFGKRSEPYLRSYTADPASDAYVRYLPRWYAQSHPAEDFAETFAYWLTAKKGADLSPAALSKLAVVDALMAEVGREKPQIIRREQTESLPQLKSTLREHYSRKRRRQFAESHAPYADFLRSAFPEPGPPSSRCSAGQYLKKRAASISRNLPAPFRGDEYSAQQVLDAMALRAAELGLRLQAGRRPPTLAALVETVLATLLEFQQGTHRLHR